MIATTGRDTAIFDLINREKGRQEHGIELIASENFVSPQVMAAVSDGVLTLLDFVLPVIPPV